MSRKPKPKKQISQPAEKVELRKLTSIKPYPRNTREHPQEQIARLADSMKRYGVDQPIVVDENGVILKGHGRRLAAYAAGFDSFPVVVQRGLSDSDKRGLRIADNQSALLAEWDGELMKAELAELVAAGFDIDQLGFDANELQAWGIGGEEPAADPDDIPDPVKIPTVRPGDIWLLGDHRLLCGDSTLKDNWLRLLNPVERAACVFTDPPYGVNYETQSGKFDAIRNDDKERDDLYRMLLTALKNMVGCSREDAAFYIWHASSTREDFSEAMNSAGLLERQYLIWVKPSIVLGRADYHWQHEPCFYASKTTCSPAFYGDKSGSTVWHVSSGGRQRDVAATIGNGLVMLDGAGNSLFVQTRTPKNKKLRQIRLTEGKSAFISGAVQDGTVWEVAREGQHVHPTQKPVELARRAIANSSRPGEIIIDGFLGSGTAIIAAEMTGRKCYGCELDPIYAQIIVERWQRFTGNTAVQADTGKTLAEIAAPHAAGGSGVAVPGQDDTRANHEPVVRARRNAAQPAARRKPHRQPSAVAGDP